LISVRQSINWDVEESLAGLISRIATVRSRSRTTHLTYSPPACGTMRLARARLQRSSARQSRPRSARCVLFFFIEVSELLDMNIRKSGANIRRVLQQVGEACAHVVLFAKLAFGAPKRTREMTRTAPSSVSSLNPCQFRYHPSVPSFSSSGGDDGSRDVFVIGATNGLDPLDPARLLPRRITSV
jgi:peroxin-6